jgi:hypothetical protein
MLQDRFGLPGPMWVAALSCVVGLALTWALLPEPKGLSLEEASRDRTFESTVVAAGATA